MHKKPLCVTSHVCASGNNLRRGERSFLLMRLILIIRSSDRSPVIDLAAMFNGAGATLCNNVTQKNDFSIFLSSARTTLAEQQVSTRDELGCVREV